MLMKKLSIKEQGGVQAKLDSEKTLHNGFGYKEFDIFCKLRIPNTVVARLMNVKSVNTIKTWKGARLELKELANAENN